MQIGDPLSFQVKIPTSVYCAVLLLIGTQLFETAFFELDAFKQNLGNSLKLFS